MRLGDDGPIVPPLAIGTMYFGTRVALGTAVDILDAALDVGATFLDATLGLSAPDVRAQTGESLRRLRTDHIDVLYAHIDDTRVPPEDTVGALQDGIRRGTVRAIVCSNITASRLREALRAAGSGPRYVAVQQRFTYLNPTPGADLSPHVLLDEVLAREATESGLRLVGYSPLLNGSYTRADRPLPDAYRHSATARQLAALTRTARATGLDVIDGKIGDYKERLASAGPVRTEQPD
ncbi:hypothetical protein JS278_01437 [Acidipropionibacterium virtanenii]|uniref:NADP-dependent oxidoreductase domain-containing protein n=2 Tax=Acidipropionibacterium virtanenii TaxID=2057246 RepID=A0A344UTK8_9ACTN|nr:hypothetical protein JS278_01437 [Acidipropionibacterium virtanenii]